jgi:hypothetical protein
MVASSAKTSRPRLPSLRGPTARARARKASISGLAEAGFAAGFAVLLDGGETSRSFAIDKPLLRTIRA